MRYVSLEEAKNKCVPKGAVIMGIFTDKVAFLFDDKLWVKHILPIIPSCEDCVTLYWAKTISCSPFHSDKD